MTVRDVPQGAHHIPLRRSRYARLIDVDIQYSESVMETLHLHWPIAIIWLEIEVGDMWNVVTGHGQGRGKREAQYG